MTTVVQIVPQIQSSQSARARKRQRQKNNLKLRMSGAFDEALRALNGFPSLANAFRAWLSYLQLYGSVPEHRSASNFARVFQAEIVRGAHTPDLCERQPVTTDFFSLAIHEFAGSFILDKNIERPSKISRVGCNLCSFVFFLGKYSVLPLTDVQKLHDYCADLGASMIRSVRAERVGEAYTSYVRESYDDADMTEHEENISLFNGGFAVSYVGKRFCLLRDWNESGLDHNAFRNVGPVKVRFPLPMTKQLKPGDHLHLEIRKMRDSSIWVPTECYGVYPEGAADEEPRASSSYMESGGRKKRIQEAPEGLQNSYGQPHSTSYERIDSRGGELSESLLHRMAQLDMNFGGIDGDGSTWENSHVHKTMDDLLPDGFDESRFSDQYFASMEVDVGDDDKGFGIYEDIDSSEGNFSDNGDETE